MRLLVTGGLGFIGSHFIRFALRKPDVESVVNIDAITYAGKLDNLKDISDEHYIFRKMNIRDGGGVRGMIKRYKITHVVHMAAESHVDRSILAPEDFLATNVTGTFNLLNAVRQADGFKRFLQVSTDEVYGSVKNGSSYEYSTLNPSSPYSASKAAADMLVLAYHKTYGVPVVITRSSNNYGTHQFSEKFIPTIIRSILKAEPVPVYGDGLNMRDWIHVEDNVRAIWAVLTAGQDGEIYNISTNRQVTNIDIINAIAHVIGHQVNMKPVPDRPGHDRRYAPDSSKLRSQLKWCPLHTFTSSLAEVISWYME